MKAGDGPAIVHAQCVRINSHSNSDRQELYRTAEEIAEAQLSDPVMRLRSYLLDKDHFSEEEIAEIEAENSHIVEEAAIKVEGSADPDPSTATNFVIPPAYEHAQEDEPSTASPSDVPSYTLREAINETMKEEFRRNQNTFLWGQDVASRDKGGVFNLTKGMQQEFGSKRVFNAHGFSRYRDD